MYISSSNKPILTFIIFLLLNFGALALGGFFTGNGVISSWYQNLNKAQWTPPGWVFGFAWTSIMICFSFYMSYWWTYSANKKWLLILFCIQWILNVSWNPMFFYFKTVGIALSVIVMLTILIGYILYKNIKLLQSKLLLLLPYFLWLLIATSLNLYIYLYN